MFRLACSRRCAQTGNTVASRLISSSHSPSSGSPPFSFQSVSSTRALPADRATFDAHGVVAFQQTPAAAASAARWRETALTCLETYSALAHSAPGGFGLKKERGFRFVSALCICS